MQNQKPTTIDTPTNHLSIPHALISNSVSFFIASYNDKWFEKIQPEQRKTVGYFPLLRTNKIKKMEQREIMDCSSIYKEIVK